MIASKVLYWSGGAGKTVQRYFLNSMNCPHGEACAYLFGFDNLVYLFSDWKIKPRTATSVAALMSPVLCGETFPWQPSKTNLCTLKCFFRACLYLCLKITPICLWLGKRLLLFMLNCLFYCYLILPNHHHALTSPCQLCLICRLGKVGWGLYYLISTFSLAQGD